jgi:large subunit ribosomal protein L24e
LTWTTAWRAFNKKIKVDDSTKKRARKTTKVQKAVVGMSLDEIKRKKAETREDRDKKTDVREKEVKDRKIKAMKDKKDTKAKTQKAAAGGAKKEKIKDKGAPAGGKQKVGGVRK